MGSRTSDDDFPGYMRRDEPQSELASWARTVGVGHEPPSNEEEAEWADFHAATRFKSLPRSDVHLADAVRDNFERSFMEASGLHPMMALTVGADMRFEVGTTPSGALVFRILLPFGLGETTTSWDGTLEDATMIAGSVGESVGADLASERSTWPPEWLTSNEG